MLDEIIASLRDDNESVRRHGAEDLGELALSAIGPMAEKVLTALRHSLSPTCVRRSPMNDGGSG
jgi:hypothetical protein